MGKHSIPLEIQVGACTDEVFRRPIIQHPAADWDSKEADDLPEHDDRMRIRSILNPEKESTNTPLLLSLQPADSRPASLVAETFSMDPLRLGPEVQDFGTEHNICADRVGVRDTISASRKSRPRTSCPNYANPL